MARQARLRVSGYLAQGGQIIDATVIAALRKTLTDEEKALVNERQSGG